MDVLYPNLEYERISRGISKVSISRAINVSARCLYNKINGKSNFSIDEAYLIQNKFFPDKTVDYLFTTKEQKKDSVVNQEKVG